MLVKLVSVFGLKIGVLFFEVEFVKGYLFFFIVVDIDDNLNSIYEIKLEVFDLVVVREC